ncbi:FeoA family protein [Sporosarcina koreensis]|uniref:Ferrous iron transport protein A n=1 Tax=Sporosarcina koreensis TaxID=334735 RepID=A0ABW0U2X5_9BACL
MQLTDIPVGKRVRITDLSRMNGLVQRRLLDLGILEGAIINIKRSLPLGGPIAIEAKGQLIGIRRSEARMVSVEIL